MVAKLSFSCEDIEVFLNYYKKILIKLYVREK
jgi:hypothetical protein